MSLATCTARSVFNIIGNAVSYYIKKSQQSKNRLLGQDNHYNSCGATRLGENITRLAHTIICRTFITEVLTPSPILCIPNFSKIHFRSPSEVHSVKHFILQSHHLQLSVKKEDLLTYSSSTVWFCLIYVHHYNT